MTTEKTDKKRPYLHHARPGVVYFRFGGKMIERLPGEEGSAEFEAAADRLCATHAKASRRKRGRPSPMLVPAKVKLGRMVQKVEGREVYRPPSIGWVIEQFLASHYFASEGSESFIPRESFRGGTQYNYRLGLDVLKAELGNCVLTDLTPRTANLYVQKIKRQSTAGGRGGSKALIQKNLLSNLWKFAKTLPQIDLGDRYNPMLNGEVNQPYRTRQEHKPWPEPVIEAFLKACDENLFLAFHLLLCTGQRISDVTKMKWFDIKNGTHIRLVQVKDRDGEEIVLKLPALLILILKKRKRVHENILTHKWDKPYTRDSLTHRIKDVLREVAPNGKFSEGGLALSNYTTHGLRKNAGILLAENGATVPQIMAALGHKTEKMALYYVRLANKKKLADQAADIMDGALRDVSERRAAAKRAKIKRVK